jgi:hypothetical protein
MNHLTEEQLVEHYLTEGGNRVVVETHLRICSRCEQAFEEIANAMDVRHPEPPARERGYGERVWQSIQAPLRPYPARAKRSYVLWPRLGLAAACALCLALAFLIGSLWERSRNHPTNALNPAQAKERVVLLILDDHLDRSERLLVQLNHAGADSGDQDSGLQAEARQLLPDNRLYRQAVGSDPTMTAALDHLERVLLEISNSPGKLNSADVERIEQEMNTDSLLFQIRVLRARTSRPEPKVDSRKGASI